MGTWRILRHQGFSVADDGLDSLPIHCWRSSRFRSCRPHRLMIGCPCSCFCDKPTGMKGTGSGKAEIKRLGPYVRAHRRHYLQQGEYTICIRWGIGLSITQRGCLFPMRPALARCGEMARRSRSHRALRWQIEADGQHPRRFAQPSRSPNCGADVMRSRRHERDISKAGRDTESSNASSLRQRIREQHRPGGQLPRSPLGVVETSRCLNLRARRDGVSARRSVHPKWPAMKVRSSSLAPGGGFPDPIAT